VEEEQKYLNEPVTIPRHPTVEKTAVTWDQLKRQSRAVKKNAMPVMRQVIVSLYLIKSAKTHFYAVLPFGHARLFIKHYDMLVMEERFVLMEGTVSHIHTAVFQ